MCVAIEIYSGFFNLVGMDGGRYLLMLVLMVSVQFEQGSAGD